MNQLDQIENRIKDIVEKGTDLLPWADQGAILVSHYCEALRQFLGENPECLNNSPARLRVFMSPDEIRLWKKQPEWRHTLLESFIETTIELNCKPELLPEVIITGRNSLQENQIVFAQEEPSCAQESTGVVSLSKPLKQSSQNNKSDSGKVLINLDQTIPLDKPVINIGRRNNNDIVVNDIRVSRVHAQVRKTRNSYMIFDVGSTGGTYINGDRINSQELKSGDVISLGGYTLVFTDEKDQEPEAEREITAGFSVRNHADGS